MSSDHQDYVVILPAGFKAGPAHQWFKGAVPSHGGSIDEKVGLRSFRCSLPEPYAEQLEGHNFVDKLVKADEWKIEMEDPFKDDA
ncbi:hypothetical protein JCM6882_007966 [Rhodosporidiobolus microsporus]